MLHAIISLTGKFSITIHATAIMDIIPLGLKFNHLRIELTSKYPTIY